MKLPTLKCDVPAAQREIVKFLGMNWSDLRQEGEFSACENLSDVRYPYLCPRKSRSGAAYTSPSSIFAWDGKLIVVDGTTLLYDGEAVGTVTAGEKQFAVVNTKLCIWPDGKYLDLTTKDFGSLGGSVISAAGTTAVFTDSTITVTGQYAKTSAEYTGAFQTKIFGNGYVTRRYSSVSWTASGGWVLTGEEEVGLTGLVGTYPGTIADINVGDIVMLQASSIQGNYQINARTVDIDYDEDPTEITYGSYAENNKQGYYGKISDIVFEVIQHFDNVYIVKQTITFQVLNVANDGLDLTQTFSVGDRVSISGCTSIPGNNTGEDAYRTITGVTANTLTFAAGTFTGGNETGQFTIERPLPKLDYICESENRLWGVSNQDKTIYASALGDPKNFFVYDGLSTDGYAAAVGSEGDFTAICKYGNAVLCWKEWTLHKILGSYPAEYQMATYQYTGVRAGCHKSLRNINEVLYYLGPSGAYAYAGSAPECISRAFGQHIFGQGVSGTDGQRYYLSAKDQDGEWSLLTYDTRNGLWLREDNTPAADFCRIGDKLLFLSGNTVYTMDDGTEIVEWSATLAPFYETVQGRKRLSKLLLRVELPKGSWLRAQVRCDGGRWAECGKIVGEKADTRVLPIAPNRCDKFEVKLSGKGECAVLSLLREFRVGGSVE